MTSGDNFCLGLNEFENNVKTYWQQLQFETDFRDITLACDDGSIKTHKVLISSCSPVLKSILKLNINSHPLIYLRRVRHKDLQNLITFMHQGEVDIAEEDLSVFLEVAEDLQVRGLSVGNQEKGHPNQQESSQKYSPIIPSFPKKRKNIYKPNNSE